MVKVKKATFRDLIFLLSTLLLAFLVAFFGWFQAAHPLFILVVIVIMIFTYKVGKRLSPKLAVFSILVIFLGATFAFYEGFEESYCTKKGQNAQAISKDDFVSASKEDSEKLQPFNVEEGQKISVSFRTHMLCHKTFNPKEAILDIYGLD